MKKIILITTFCLLAIMQVKAQTWEIGTPVASNVTATFDAETRTLTISGTGAMQNFTFNPVPWSAFRGHIERVVITQGVTNIGNNTFSGLNVLTVTIPNSVTSIGSGAFQGATSLTSVTIPNSVTSIGESAFRGATSLTSITIPSSVTSISGSAFRDATSLASIIILEGVTNIGNNAFRGATSLTSVTIPNSVTSIGREAFRDATSLASITIPEGVTSIGVWAFRDCASLTSITIPSSVTSIGAGAFDGCTALTAINVNSANANFSSRDGVLFNRTGTTLIRYPQGKREAYYSIPNGVTMIEGSFRDHTSGADVGGAFRGATSLTSVTIPESVTNIGSNVFSGCTSLRSITLRNPLPLAFPISGGISPSRILLIVPVGSAEAYRSSVTWRDFLIVEDGFEFPCDAPPRAFGRFGTNNALTWFLCPNGTFVIDGNGAMPNFTSSNNQPWASYRASITRIMIEEGVTNIGNNAFRDATSLTSIAIPSSVTSIGADAFRSATSLATIIIPEGVTSIGNNAFNGCIALTSITIPSSVTSIGSGAFNGCTALTEITINNPVPPTFLGNFTFQGVNTANVTLIVPEEGIEAYRAHTVWRTFRFAEIPVSSISLNTTEATVEAGATKQLVATILPTHATNQSVVWQSSNPEVATVSGSGLITAVSTGTATITATTEDGEFTATCTVTVTLPQAVSDVISLIDNLPSATDLTLDNADVVTAARTAYNNLSALLRALVTNLATLTAAEARIAELTAMQTEVSEINTLITALSAHTTSSALQTAVSAIDSRIAEWDGTTLVGIDTTTLEAERARIATLQSNEQTQAAMEAEVLEINTLIAALSVHTTSAALQIAVQAIESRIAGWSGIALVGINTTVFETERIRIVTLQNNEQAEADQTAMQAEVSEINALIIALSAYTTSADLQTAVSAIDSRIATWDGIALVGIDTTALEAERARIAVLQEQEAIVSVTGVSLNRSELTLIVGETDMLIATVLPEDALNQNIIWTSTRPGIASVNDTGRITAAVAGTTTITVTTIDGGFEATATITVEPSDDLLGVWHVGYPWTTSITATLTDDGVLRISGSGSMQDFTPENPAPWAGRTDITRVVVERDVQSVSNRAFFGLPQLISADLSETVNLVGEAAFAQSALESIAIAPQQHLHFHFASDAFADVTSTTLRILVPENLLPQYEWLHEWLEDVNIVVDVDYSWLTMPVIVVIQRDEYLEVRVRGSEIANTFNRLEVTEVSLWNDWRSPESTVIPQTDGSWFVPVPWGSSIEIRVTNSAGAVLTRRFQRQ